MKILRVILTVLFLCCTVNGYALTQNNIDNRAYNVPSIHNNDISGLVGYLIQPVRNNDKLKARVIFAWIAYHIQYDFYEADTSYEMRNLKFNASALETFKKRSGVCRDMALLYKYMAEIAGLESVVITGLSEGNMHAWNAVMINNKWELLDVTWASRSANTFRNIRNDKAYEKLLVKRQKNIKMNRNKNGRRIDNQWFMTPPEEMIKTHLPANKKWALLSMDYQYQKALNKYPKKMDMMTTSFTFIGPSRKLNDPPRKTKKKVATKDLLKMMSVSEAAN